MYMKAKKKARKPKVFAPGLGIRLYVLEKVLVCRFEAEEAERQRIMAFLGVKG